MREELLHDLRFDSAHNMSRYSKIVRDDGRTLMLSDKITNLESASSVAQGRITQAGPPEYVAPGYRGLPKGLPRVG